MEHHYSAWGVLGAVIAFISPWLSDLGLIVQTIAGLGGLILLGYSIYYKRLQIKQLKKEIEDTGN